MKNRIAVFTNGWSNEYIENVVEGIRRKAKENGTDVFIFATYTFFTDSSIQSKCQLNLFHLPAPEDFDGAILLTNTFNLPDEAERIVTLWERKNVPMISLEVKLPGIPYLGTDNYTGMHDLAEHLITVHGAGKIVYVGGIEGNQENIIRKQALEDALHEHGLELVYSENGDFGFYTSVKIANDWIDNGREMPDAFVCANDVTAIGLCNAFSERGISIPNDVIVTGFDGMSDGKKTFPLLTTVSRGWDALGEHAYEKLYYHIDHPDEDIDTVFSSVFEAGESCGCSIDKAAVNTRLKMLRNVYLDSVKYLTLDMYFQNIRIGMSTLASKDDFFHNLSPILEMGTYPANDFVLCVEPDFFELDDMEYPERIRGYSHEMELLVEMREGKAYPPSRISRNTLYPRYEHKEGQSDTYLFIPLNHLDYIIGYVGIKNDLSMLYDQSLRRWSMNMNTCFMQARQYIFSRQANEKLRKIYLTDLLTGMYNRTGCEDVLYKFVESEKAQGSSVILLFADINRMKTINDVYGHLNGDFAIKASADAMMQALGNEDWLFGRYGGDEFVAVGRYDRAMDAEKFRSELNSSMNSFFESLNVNFPLSVSVGYYIINSGDSGTIEDYIRRADSSMYEQKQIAHRLADEKNKG